MFFSNLNNLSVIIFILFLVIWIYLLYQICKYKKNLYSSIFLFISFLFVIINIFEVKWWINSKLETVEWWKVVFVLDVSKSMDTLDWLDNNKEISRLELWKKLINTYISKNLNNNYWLMIFSWESIEILPFTNDLSLFNTVLFSINNKNISKNWTNLNSVFDSLNNYFNNDEWWTIVILTDWWDEKINISQKAIDTINEKWLKVSIIWIWSEKWWKIPIWKNMYGITTYKLYKWEEVITKLNINELKYITNKYNFSYKEFINFENINNINDFISNNVNLSIMKKNIDYRFDFTRIFILISFVFFILFLISDNFLWLKK